MDVADRPPKISLLVVGNTYRVLIIIIRQPSPSLPRRTVLPQLLLAFSCPWDSPTSHRSHLLQPLNEHRHVMDLIVEMIAVIPLAVSTFSGGDLRHRPEDQTLRDRLCNLKHIFCKTLW